MNAGSVLVTGATGLLGPYLVEVATRLGSVLTTSLHGGDVPCDLTKADATKRLCALVNPRIVIHTAALTQVDACEADQLAATRLNRGIVENLVHALPADAELVHISTDQVYPDTPGPHDEDEVGPVNAYGRSKLAGEEIAPRHARPIVLRPPSFGPSRTPGRASLSDFVVETLTHRQPVTLFRDSLFSPLQMKTLSALVMECLEAGVHGVFNLGSREGTSKLEFGLAVARHLGLPTDSASPGNSRDLPGRAPRAVDLRMSVARIEASLGRAMPTLHEEIQKL